VWFWFALTVRRINGMVFSSIIFLCYFLPITLAGYFFAPKKWKNLLLILVSLFFYAWGEGVYIVFLLISAIITHFSVVKIQGKGKFQKGWFIFSLIMNLGMLGFMKYAIFLIANINYFFSIISVPLIPIPDIHLPIGISFFVFQAVS
jgi:alginate O-acetyltransferase complex protein AlgI